MVLVGDIITQGQNLFGLDMAEAHVPGELWLTAVNWSIRQLNRVRRVCTAMDPLDTHTRDLITLPTACEQLLLVYRNKGGIMRVLPKAEFNYLMQRRPDFETTTKEATSWAFVRSDQIVLDGAVGTNEVMIHYLQAPGVVYSPADSLDVRFAGIDRMAFAYLAAAYCLQVAGDAASLRKAGQYFAQGLRLAGVRERVSMPVVNDGGEREAQHEGE